MANVLEFQLQHQSYQWTPRLISFRMDWLDLLAVQGLSDCQHIQILRLDLLNFNYLCNSFPLYPGSDIISYKRSFSKYFRLSRPDGLCHNCSSLEDNNGRGWCVTEWAWICFNITLFTIRGHEMDFPHKPYFTDLCYLLWPIWRPKHDFLSAAAAKHISPVQLCVTP